MYVPLENVFELESKRRKKRKWIFKKEMTATESNPNPLH